MYALKQKYNIYMASQWWGNWYCLYRNIIFFCLKRTYFKRKYATVTAVMVLKLLFATINHRSKLRLSETTEIPTMTHDSTIIYGTNPNVLFSRRFSVFGPNLNGSGPAGEGVAPRLLLLVVWGKRHHSKSAWIIKITFKRFLNQKNRK